MNWEAIGAVGELIGAVIVVVSVYFLANQIRQGNKLGTAAAEREWFDGWNDIIRHLATDTDTGAIMQAGFRDYSALTAPQKAVFMTKLTGVFNQAELALRLRDKGLLDAELIGKVMDICAGILLTKGAAEWWDEIGPSYAIHTRMVEWRKRTDRLFVAWDTLSAWRASDAL